MKDRVFLSLAFVIMISSMLCNSPTYLESIGWLSVMLIIGSAFVFILESFNNQIEKRDSLKTELENIKETQNNEFKE